MTVAEAAREISLSADAVYDLCKRGLLGHRRIGPRRGRIEITAAHVERYRESCEVPVGAPPATGPRPPVRARCRSGRLDGKPNRWLK